GKLLPQHFERRTLDRTLGERVLDHAQINLRLPRLLAELGHLRDAQAAALGQYRRLRRLELLGDFGDHRFLLLNIKTHTSHLFCLYYYRRPYSGRAARITAGISCIGSTVYAGY